MKYVWAACCALAGISAAGCSEAVQEPPNILLISIDTLRSDHLGCYGYARATSPHIDALAARGTVFEQVFSSANWTLPAHASMLTGLYPSFHGLMDDGVKLPAGVTTLAEELSDLGYRGLAVTSHVYVSSAFGLERGFEAFDDSLLEGGTRNPIAGEVVDRFVELFDELQPERFFGLVHLFDPHWSYTPPAPWDARFTAADYQGPVDGHMSSIQAFFHPRNEMPAADMAQAIGLYDGEIAYVDEQLGRLFAALEERGQLENTVIVVTGDHGEEFKDHRGLGHGRTMFVEQLSVPFVIAGHPAFPAGTRRRDPISPVDLAPTLLSLAGASPKALEGFQGRSAAWESDPERTLFAESIRFGLELRAVRNGRHKLVRIGEEEFYFDLVRDPRETRMSRDDPSGGVLPRALSKYVEGADSGWHLKLLSQGTEPLTCRATIETTGEIVGLRRYFSENINGRVARFERFELSADKKRLELELVIQGTNGHMGEIVFDTAPREAAVTVTIATEGPGAPGVFLGAGLAVTNGEALPLQRDDPRLVGLPDYSRATAGAYLRAVKPVEADAEAAGLRKETIEHLRGLGYTDAGE